mgnify:CR=1 FL=1
MDNAELFEQEEKDLMKDLAILPRQSAVRKINELVKRIRKVKALAHMYVLVEYYCSSLLLVVLQLTIFLKTRIICEHSVGYLKSQMPTLMGKEKKQQKLINDLPNVFRTILKKYNLAPGDFPVSAERTISFSCFRLQFLLTG